MAKVRKNAKKETMPSGIKTSILQKTLLIALGIILGIAILEFILRIGGFALHDRKSALYEEDKVRILCLGESTTAKTPHSWPEQLQEILDNRSPGKYRVYNEGKGGTNSQLILSNLDESLEQYRPHVVITMMGINDMWSRIYIADTKPSILLRVLEQLRVYRLYKLIAFNLAHKGIAPCETPAAAPDDATRTGQDLLMKGRIELAENEFNKALSSGNNNTAAVTGLAQIYVAKATYNISWLYDAEKMYMRLLKLQPTNLQAYSNLAVIYDTLNKTKEKEDLLKRGLSLRCSGNFDQLYNSLFRMQEEKKEPDTSLLLEKGFAMHREAMSFRNNTAYHYRLLYNTLKSRDIKYIAMQYPTMDVDGLKGYFTSDEQERIIFVENRENFDSALSRYRIEEIFLDKFAYGSGSMFGHCTEKGDRLIAESAAIAVLDLAE